MKLWIELVKLINEHDNLSKPFAPLINSLTISVNICVLETLCGELIDWSSIDPDDGIEWNDNGVDVWRFNSISVDNKGRFSLKKSIFNEKDKSEKIFYHHKLIF